MLSCRVELKKPDSGSLQRDRAGAYGSAMTKDESLPTTTDLGVKSATSPIIKALFYEKIWHNTHPGKIDLRSHPELKVSQVLRFD